MGWPEAVVVIAVLAALVAIAWAVVWLAARALIGESNDER